MIRQRNGMWIRDARHVLCPGKGGLALGALLASVLAGACADATSDAGPTPQMDGVAAVFDGTGGEWIDLTHAYGPGTIYWPTDTAGFQMEELAYGVTEGGWFYSSYAFATAEHGGTHLDAPIHFAEGRRTADEIPIGGLIGPAAVVDVTARAHADYLVSIEDLQGFESEHGRIPEGAILLLRTGWADRWADRAAYLGTDAVGPEAVPLLHFPGLAPEAAQWLVENRALRAVGIDTPSIDYGQSQDFRAHVVLYSADIPGFENVGDLARVPATGAYVVAFPMKIEGGSGGPLRIAAFVPN
jgi:kynurenine formamidase